MMASRSYDVVWPHWSKAKPSAWLGAAMKEFDTCFASLSFFDGKYESFKAEVGYNASRISRAVSIAAHALLSTDVFVVLDTKQVGVNPHVIDSLCSLMSGLAISR
jgi:hypothetical protein